METRKILSLIFSLIFLGAFAFVLSWGIINFNKVKEGMSGTQIYTNDDVQKAYQDGYDTALKNKSEYDTLISGYRDTITTLNDNISQLNSQVNEAGKLNRDYKAQVDNLTEIKTQNENFIEDLQSVIAVNEQTISGLNLQVENLQKEIRNLQSNEIENLEEIERLNGQIRNLQNLSAQLQATNELNLATINNLNGQVLSLNNQITELTLQMQGNNSQVNNLNNKIAELERSVAYYESYIASLESGEQVVATFEFNGSVYNIQVLTKNAIASVTEPTSTEYVIFKGWLVDGVRVNLNTYQVTQNTKFVADVDYKYAVTFVVDDRTVSSQIVSKNDIAVSPTAPSKAGYDFDGWSIDTVNVIDVNTNRITANTTYTAIFTKLHTITFVYEGEVVGTQTVRNGSYARAPLVEDTLHKVFNGWKLNNVIVDVSNYKITGAVTFVADVTYKYDVNFIVDGNAYDSQVIILNRYAEVPAAPYKSGYEFDGWIVNGSDKTVNVATTPITANTTFVAKFTQLFEVRFEIDGVLVDKQTLRDGSYARLPNTPSKENYLFKGWESNGAIIDVATYRVRSNMTFVAKFIPIKIPKGAYCFKTEFLSDGWSRYPGMEVIAEIDANGNLKNATEVNFHNTTYNNFEMYQSNMSTLVAIIRSNGMYDNDYYEINFVYDLDNGTWSCVNVNCQDMYGTVEITNFEYSFFTVREYEGALGDPFGYYQYSIATYSGVQLEGILVYGDGKVYGMECGTGDVIVSASVVVDEWGNVSVTVVQQTFRTTYTIEFGYWYGFYVSVITSSNGETWWNSDLMWENCDKHYLGYGY